MVFESLLIELNKSKIGNFNANAVNLSRVLGVSVWLKKLTEEKIPFSFDKSAW